MTTQNYATVPYLFLFFNQGRVRDFQIPVLLNMKWIAHVLSKQDHTHRYGLAWYLYIYTHVYVYAHIYMHAIRYSLMYIYIYR